MDRIDGQTDTADLTPALMRPVRLDRVLERLALIVLVSSVLILAATATRWWPVVTDEQALAAWVDRLGWFGPLALVILNAIQIVVAPIPGYVVQIAAGFLYGPLWGGVWGSLGLVLGGATAFTIARRYGRPPAERLIGRERLARWERVTHSTNPAIWFVLLLSPTGDVPYYLAGLAHVSLLRILIITVILRVPSVFVAAAAGSGVMFLAWWQLVLIVAVLAVLLVLFMRHHDAITAWSEARIERRLDASLRKDPGYVPAQPCANDPTS